jgi:cytochrome c oxidase subunit 3
MFFVALTSALLVRRASGEWGAIPAPPMLWLTTAAIIASSLILERGRGVLRAGAEPAFRRNLLWAAGLGLAFMLGQLATWQTLASNGVYLATNPHSSYFYLLTGAHVVHLVGGLAGMLLVAGKMSPVAADGLAVYWHFLAGLWVYLFAVLFWF